MISDKRIKELTSERRFVEDTTKIDKHISETFYRYYKTLYPKWTGSITNHTKEMLLMFRAGYKASKLK